MIELKTLRGFEFWKSKLGLLPVGLFRDSEQAPPFVVLNGARGNFCVDFGTYELSDATRAYAWSANVGHYVSITRDNVEVQRWDQRRATIERYKYEAVAKNLEAFHAYLEKDPPKHDLSVVAHSIRVFRTLRATLGSAVTGPDALRAYLYLLAASADRSERGRVQLGQWRLDAGAEQIASLVSQDKWDAVARELMRGRPHESLVPDLHLVLRHASGQLFQEAHYEALFFDQGQLLLDGFIPQPVSVGSRTVSIGLHFTPPAIARTVVEETLNLTNLDQEELVVFDPACGSGEFLREALRQLKIANYAGKVLLIGWDISEAACDMANFVLAWEARDARAAVEISVRRIDSLSEEPWPANVDWLLMNPPFVAWPDMSSHQRDNVRRVLGDLAVHRADMAHAFVWRAAQAVRNGGILGTVAPASLLDGDSAARLRMALGEIVEARLIARLGSHSLFLSAIVDAALYIGIRGQHDQPTATVAFWADHQLSSNAAGLRSLRRLRGMSLPTDFPVLGDGFSIYLDTKIGHGNGPWSPRPYESWRIGQNLTGFPQVSELFDVKQGIRTGYNPAFLLSRSEFYSLPEGERIYFRPAVVNKSIRFGYLSDVEYVFYPHGEKKVATEDELQSKLPEFYRRYLIPAKTHLLARPRVNPERWWELSEHRAWQIAPEEKIVSTYFGGPGSFAWDEVGSFAVVQGYAWLPRKRQALTSRIGLAYVALFNSRFFEMLVAGVSNHVAGGQWNLSKKFVERIAIPNLFEETVSSSLIAELSALGSRMASGLPIDDKRLETLVAELYNAEKTL